MVRTHSEHRTWTFKETNYSSLTGKDLVFSIGGRLREGVAFKGSTVVKSSGSSKNL